MSLAKRGPTFFHSGYPPGSTTPCRLWLASDSHGTGSACPRNQAQASSASTPAWAWELGIDFAGPVQ